MKTASDCLESIQNGEHEKYPYTLALTDFIEPDRAEGMIKALCQAKEIINTASFIVFASSIANAINDAMQERANNMSQASVTPLDNDTNIADLKREM